MNSTSKKLKDKGKDKAKPNKLKPAPQFPIELRFGSKSKGMPPLDAGNIDTTTLAVISEQANGEKMKGVKASMRADSVWSWPADFQRAFWSLWRTIKNDREVSLEVDGHEYARPIDLALNGLVSPTSDPEAFSRTLAFAGETVARCYPAEDSPAYVEAVLEKVKELGVKGKPLEALRSQIRSRIKAAHSSTAGNGTAPIKGEVSPYALARLFLEREHRLNTGDPNIDDDDDDDVDEDDDDDEDTESGGVEGGGGERYGLRYYDERFFRRRTGVWMPVSTEDVRLELTGFLQKNSPDATGTRRIADVLANVKSLCRLVIDRTPPLPFYIGGTGGLPTAKGRKFLALQNGLLDLDALAKVGKPKLVPHDPRWLSTFILTYKFDAKAQCPKWNKFLQQVFEGDPKTGKPVLEGDRRIDVLQELFGYCLLSDARYQKFFLLTGEGSNGKGVTSRVLQAMLGAENVAGSGMDALGKQFGLAPLIDKLANISGDLNEVDNIAEGIIKQVTGEDPMTVDRKHRDPVEWVPTVKLIFLCNDLPRFKDKSNGTWRREIVIPYHKQVAAAQVDTQLTTKLTEELPGILNWAIAGLRRLLEQGKFTDCKVCQAAATKHRQSSDPFAQFIEERVVLAVEGIQGRYQVGKDVLYQAYAEWCTESGYHAVGKNAFGSRILKLKGVGEKRLQAEKKGGKRPEVWRGIALDAPMNVYLGGQTKVKHKTVKPTLTAGEGVECGPNGQPMPSKKKTTKSKGGKTKGGKTKGGD